MSKKKKFSSVKGGDISTNTLVVIIIGIIVLVVFIYLMFFYSKESSLNCRLCSSRFASWCQKCATAEGNWKNPTWPNDVEKSKELKECIESCLKITPTDVCNTLRDKCKGYLPNMTGVF
jgi:flagellar basal body-associated protein FliL